MTFFDGVNVRQLSEPQVNGRLVVRASVNFGDHIKIETDESCSLIRIRHTFSKICSYLDYKSLLAFYGTSKVMQYLLNKSDCKPVAITFESDVQSLIKYADYLSLKTSIEGLRIDYLDLHRCRNSFFLFNHLNKYITQNLKHVRFLNLSGAVRAQQPVMPCRLSLCQEYVDTRSNAQILSQGKINDVPVKDLLENLRKMTTLNSLLIANQFYDYRLRDAFRRELKDIQVQF